MKSHVSMCVLCALTLSAGSANAQSGNAHEHAHEHAHEDHPNTERIIVTATPLAHTRDELAMPVDRLDRDEILERLGTTIGETLSRSPGVATTGFAGGASRPVIRGQDAFRTEVLEDGLTTQDVSRLSPDHGVPINPLSARSIEIVRGPATLRYGGGATAGVVNTITGRVPQQPLDETATAELFTSWGSNDNEAVGALVADGAIGAVTWHADALYQRADDYEVGGGDVQSGTRHEGGAGAVGATWFGERARIGASYTHFRNNYGIPEPGEDVEIEMDTNRYRIESDIDAPLPGIRALRMLGVYSDYEHKELADGTVGQLFDNDEFEGRAEFLHEPIWGLSGAVGITGRHRDFEAGGEAAEFLAPTSTRTVAGYVFEERSLSDAFEAQFGLRVEGTEVAGTPRGGTRTSRSFVPVSGSLGLVAHPLENWTLGMTAAASQRAPADVELFARGPHEATGTFELGNAGLDPETSYTGEVRLSGEWGWLRFDAATFLTHYEDYIAANLTGNNVDEDGLAPGPLDELVYLGRDARFYGGEISAQADVATIADGNVLLDAQLDWVRAKFLDASESVDGDRDVPRVTPLRWGGGLAYRGERVSGRIGFLRVERQRHPGSFETATDAYTLVDLSLVYSMNLCADRLALDWTLDARNLADQAARNPVAINKDDVLLRGRTVRLGVRGRF